MKKIILAVSAVFMLIFTSCDFSRGTYYPKSDEMAANLKEKGYTVTVSHNIEGSSGTHLIAFKEKDYMEFYWLETGKNMDSIVDEMKERHSGQSGRSISMRGDDTYGNIAYCCSNNAYSDAGIVKAKDVKVEDVRIEVWDD